MCTAEVQEKLNAEFTKGASYRWVWYWQHLDGRQEVTIMRTMGQHEAKLRAEREQCLGLGYQYVPGNSQPVKVALVFPKRWVVDYTIHKNGNAIYQLFRKTVGDDKALIERHVEDLTGQFPEAFKAVTVADVKIGCIQ